MDLYDVLRIVWRRKGTILLVLFLSCGGALAASLLLPKVYEARATLIFPERTPGGASGLASLLSSAGLKRLPALAGADGMLGGTHATAEVVEAMLRSRTLATQVVQDCDLKRVYKVSSLEKAVRGLQAATTVRQEKSQALMVAVRAPSPQLAATVTNRTVEELERMVEQQVDLFLARKNRRFIEAQLSRVRADLAAAEERLKRFQQSSAIVSLSEEAKVAIEKMAEIEKERTLARVVAADTEAQLAEVRRQVEAQTQGTVERLPAHSPVMRDLRQQLIELNAKLAVANREFTPAHPTVQQLQAEVDETRRQLGVEQQRVRRSLKTGLAPELAKLEVAKMADEARLSAINGAVRRFRAEFERLPDQGMQLVRLMRDREVQEGVYTLLTAEYEKAKLAEAREGPSFIVLDRAVAPERHVFPRTLINIVVAALFGLWIGATLAFLQERAQAIEAPDADLPAFEERLGSPHLEPGVENGELPAPHDGRRPEIRGSLEPGAGGAPADERERVAEP